MLPVSHFSAISEVEVICDSEGQNGYKLTMGVADTILNGKEIRNQGTAKIVTPF